MKSDVKFCHAGKERVTRASPGKTDNDGSQMKGTVPKRSKT